MATWGSPWAITSTWGIASAGANAACELAEERVLVQMDDTVGNRKFRDFMCILAEPFGIYTEVMADLKAAFDIETAIGVQLDIIGSIIDLPRSGLADDRYRIFLRIQTEILLGQVTGDWTGSVNNILTMVRTLIGTGVVTPINYILHPPYTFELIIPGVFPVSEIRLLFRLICRAIYAAVLGFVAFVPLGENLWQYTDLSVTDGGVWCYTDGSVPDCAVWSYVIPTTDC